MKFFIAGGAGFIGSHFVDHLLPEHHVTVFDNFSSGRAWHLEHHHSNSHLDVVEADLKDSATLLKAIKGSDVVIHLASNPDIAKAASEPDIDFWQGTFLTNQVLEAMRTAGVGTILYASGSGVYGDTGTAVVAENHTPMAPISTYGASKLAGEALIYAYSHMFGIVGRCFRFGNVIGSRQTHGVGFDFLRKLKDNATTLEILGNGEQNKSYIHVDDAIAAVLLALRAGQNRCDVFNVATADTLTVKEIADLVIAELGLAPGAVRLVFTGGDRGWKGDVPIVRLNSDKIRRLGWSERHSSRQAMAQALRAMNTATRGGIA